MPEQRLQKTRDAYRSHTWFVYGRPIEELTLEELQRTRIGLALGTVLHGETLQRELAQLDADIQRKQNEAR